MKEEMYLWRAQYLDSNGFIVVAKNVFAETLQAAYQNAVELARHHLAPIDASWVHILQEPSIWPGKEKPLHIVPILTLDKAGRPAAFPAP